MGARAGSQSSSDGTKGTEVIYIHRGSVSGALLSSHFGSLHWHTLKVSPQKSDKAAQNPTDHFKVTLKSPVNKKGQLLCLSPVTCVPASAQCLPPSPHQPQDVLCGARPTLSQTETAAKAHVLGFLLSHHTKSCSFVVGTQT